MEALKEDSEEEPSHVCSEEDGDKDSENDEVVKSKEKNETRSLPPSAPYPNRPVTKEVGLVYHCY